MRPEPTPPAPCAEAQRYLDLYVDSELDAAGRAEIEQHLAGCPGCSRQARVLAGFKAGLKAAAPRPPLPDGLRDRVQVALAREPTPGPRTRLGATLARIAPAAAAALVVGALIGSTHSFSPVAAEAISAHHRALPMEVAGSPAQVRDWFQQKVDFPVRPPQLPGATLVGARLATIRDRQAAYLVYNVSGNRVSVFLFDPANLPIDARRRRTAAGHEVYLDDQRGYHVALGRNGGLGFAVASDLDEDRLFQLASSTISR